MTVKEIYDITMALMDEMIDNKTIEANPEADYKSTKDYTARTPGILTILQTQVISYLKRFGADIDFVEPLENMDSEMSVDDSICMGVLPYGLAARLLGQEDTSLSSYFSNLYDTNLAMARDSIDDKYTAEQKERENVYGLFRAGD